VSKSYYHSSPLANPFKKLGAIPNAYLMVFVSHDEALGCGGDAVTC